MLSSSLQFLASMREDLDRVFYIPGKQILRIMNIKYYEQLKTIWGNTIIIETIEIFSQ